MNIFATSFVKENLVPVPDFRILVLEISMKLHVSSSFMVSFDLKLRFKTFNLVTQKETACQCGLLFLKLQL